MMKTIYTKRVTERIIGDVHSKKELVAKINRYSTLLSVSFCSNLSDNSQTRPISTNNNNTYTMVCMS
jgi:hypothetical protein